MAMELSSTTQIAHSSALLLLLSFLVFSGGGMWTTVASLGINYGQIGNNLPRPEKAVELVKGIGATKVKLYDADPKVLKAFAKTGMELMVSVVNEDLGEISSSVKNAQDWVHQNVVAYLPDTNITTILIGNEVLTNDTSLSVSAILLSAMHNIYSALVTTDGLHRQISVTTAHNLAILQTSYPPSAGAFRRDVSPCISQILDFHTRTGSPFLINAYPYFAYKANPKQVSLDFVLFQANQGFVDPASHLRYDNMLFAQVDAAYSAIASLGYKYKNVQVQVSETGWPSKGDDDEAGATPENAKKYNGNLIKVISQRKVTPSRPNCDLNVFVFALFNENMKPGPTSERNYGLFNPDGSPSYSLGIAALQAVGNSTTGAGAGAAGPPTTSTGSPPSSTGYLSISSAPMTERYPYADLCLILWGLALLMVEVV